MCVESRLVMRNEYQMKLSELRHIKACWHGGFVAVVIVSYHPLLIFLPLFDKPIPILNYIVTFVTINIHALLLLAISPI